MAELTSDKSYITALGPLKIEFVICEVPSNDDTYISKLANPTVAVALQSGDQAATTQNVSASISSKTVTLHDVDGSSDVVLMIFGDSLAKAT